MSALGSLPTELKDLITEYLSSEDLLRLSTTCKELYVYALPLAYRTTTLTWAQRPVQHDDVVMSPKLHALLRALVKKPGLATAVKSVHFEAINCISFPNTNLHVDIPGRTTELNDEDLALLQRALASQGLTEESSWASAITGPQHFFVVMAKWLHIVRSLRD